MAEYPPSVLCRWREESPQLPRDGGQMSFPSGQKLYEYQHEVPIKTSSGQKLPEDARAAKERRGVTTEGLPISWGPDPCRRAPAGHQSAPG